MKRCMHLFICLSLLIPFCFGICEHDELSFTLDYVSVDVPQGRMLGTSERENLRIAAFYYLEDPLGIIATKIKNQLIPAAISFYGSALKVDRLTSNIKIADNIARQCGDVDPPDILSGDGIPVDLVLFVKGQTTEGTSATASARPCVLAKPTDRPMLGVITYHYGSAWTGTSELAYEGDLLTTLHELAHALGFTPSLFDNYIDPQTGNKLTNPLSTKLVNGRNTSVLSLEPLNSRLRSYFNCPTLDGEYLENQGEAGSRGSHFERRVFFNEFMTASEGQDVRVSQFTLALLEGTGWYTPNYDMADPLFWGKGKGCDFLDTTCIDPASKTAKFDEFCSDRQAAGCTYVGTVKAFCGTSSSAKSSDLPAEFNYFGDNSVMFDNFADNCPYNYGISNLNCIDPSSTIKEIKEEFYGEGSMCFVGNLGKKAPLAKDLAYCFKQKCQEVTPNNYVLDLEIGNQTIRCPSEKTITVPGYQGVLKCPNTNFFCSTKAIKYCKRGCLGRGTCVNGECVCKPGYSGKSCLFKDDAMPPEGLLVEPPSEESPFLHPIAIAIGIGIIVIIMIVALVINHINKNHDHQEAGYMSVNQINKNKKPPILFEKEEKAGRQEKDINLGLAVQIQPQVASSAAIRQQALENNSDQTRNNDPLSRIRGAKNQF